MPLVSFAHLLMGATYGCHPDSLDKDAASKKPFQISGSRPLIPEQLKDAMPEEEEKATVAAKAGHKRTASAADLDVPDFKKSKVDAEGRILLEDSDDDLEIL